MSSDQSKFVVAWNRFREEAIAVIKVTFDHMRKFVRLARDAFRERQLRRQSDAKREALGQSLLDTDTGSEALREQYRQLQERITNVEAASGSTKPLLIERRGVLLRLADDFLEMLPSVDTAQEPGPVTVARRDVDGAVQEHQTHREKLERARADLKNLDSVEKRRLWIGYAIAAFVLVLLLWILSSVLRTEDTGDSPDLKQKPSAQSTGEPDA